MNSGPTMTKLVILLTIITFIYIVFALPIFSAAYIAFKSRDLSTFVDYFTNKLKVFR